ncbi:hypothetical protein [Streptomyces sp. NPDC008122]|uniref:hypothetical protein n=1 Tax=Streptomyces sp. NPDC008122 TaxID=3364810 RepID=UPI0036E77525
MDRVVEEERVRDALLGPAGNPALTDGLFARLVADSDEDVLYALAGREQLTASQVRALLGVGDPAVTRYLVRTGLVPWSAVPEDHPGRTLDAVIGGAAPLDAWWKAAADPDPEVRRAVAENPAVPLDLLVTVAAHERLPAEPAPRVESATEAELRSLAGSRVAQVRALVADRTRLPGDLVERLAADPDPGVARRIAARPDLAPEQLADLVERHGPPVFSAVARHPDCPADVLHRVAAHPATGRRVLRDIARHPASRAETLLRCLAAEDPDVRRYAATHPALPVTVLESLLHGPDEALALAAAENPALPETVMKRIVE